MKRSHKIGTSILSGIATLSLFPSIVCGGAWQTNDPPLTPPGAGQAKIKMTEPAVNGQELLPWPSRVPGNVARIRMDQSTPTGPQPSGAVPAPTTLAPQRSGGTTVVVAPSASAPQPAATGTPKAPAHSGILITNSFDRVPTAKNSGSPEGIRPAGYWSPETTAEKTKSNQVPPPPPFRRLPTPTREEVLTGSIQKASGIDDSIRSGSQDPPLQDQEILFAERRASGSGSPANPAGGRSLQEPVPATDPRRPPPAALPPPQTGTPRGMLPNQPTNNSPSDPKPATPTPAAMPPSGSNSPGPARAQFGDQTPASQPANGMVPRAAVPSFRLQDQTGASAVPPPPPRPSPGASLPIPSSPYVPFSGELQQGLNGSAPSPANSAPMGSSLETSTWSEPPRSSERTGLLRRDQWDSQQRGGSQFYCDNLFNSTVFVGNNSVSDFQFDRGATLNDSGGLRLKDGVMVGGSLGLYQGANLRSDLELSYRTNAIESIFYQSAPNGPLFETGVDGDLKVFSGISNFYWDFVNIRTRWFKPYVGGGVGFAHLSTDLNNFGRSLLDPAYETDTSLVYQWMAGVNGNLSRDIDWFVEYRALTADNLDLRIDYATPLGNPMLPGNLPGRFDYSSDSILMGLRIRF